MSSGSQQTIEVLSEFDADKESQQKLPGYGLSGASLQGDEEFDVEL